MYREFAKDSGNAVSRPRGKSPQKCTFFTRTPQHKDESSLLASLCSPLGALSRTGTAYHDLVADPHISFKYLVFLISALAAGEELTLASCEDCGALTVGERSSFSARQRLLCASRAEPSESG